MPSSSGGSSPSSAWREAMQEAAPYLGLGMQFALTMAFFTAVGYGLDRWLGLMPWLTIAGALVGMFALFVLLIRVSNQAAEQSRAARKKKQEKSPHRSES